MGVLEKWNMASARWSHGLHDKTLAFPQQTLPQMLWDEEEAAAGILEYFPGHVGGDGGDNGPGPGQSR